MKRNFRKVVLCILTMVLISCESGVDHANPTQESTFTATPPQSVTSVEEPTITWTEEVGVESEQYFRDLLNFSDVVPGQYLLVQTYNDSRYLYLISIEGEIVRKIPLDAQLGVSNDGTQLLIMPMGLDLAYNLDLSTNTWTSIEIDHECYSANWSSDKRYIALSCINNWSSEIYIIDISSGSNTQITDCEERDHACGQPSWSFDGQWLSYSRSEIRSGIHTLDGIYYFNTNCFQEHNCMTYQVGPLLSDSTATWSTANEMITLYDNNIQFYEIGNHTPVLQQSVSINIENMKYISLSPNEEYLALEPVDNLLIYVYNLFTNTLEILLEEDSPLHLVGWITLPIP